MKNRNQNQLASIIVAMACYYATKVTLTRCGTTGSRCKGQRRGTCTCPTALWCVGSDAARPALQSPPLGPEPERWNDNDEVAMGRTNVGKEGAGGKSVFFVPCPPGRNLTIVHRIR